MRRLCVEPRMNGEEKSSCHAPRKRPATIPRHGRQQSLLPDSLVLGSYKLVEVWQLSIRYFSYETHYPLIATADLVTAAAAAGVANKHLVRARST